MLNLQGIFKDEKLLLRMYGAYVVVALSVAPGGLLLLIERSSFFSDFEVMKLLFTCFILSVPFNILGLLMFLSPRQTILDLSTQASSRLGWTVFIGSYVWSLLSVGVLYISVHLMPPEIARIFGNNKVSLYITSFAFLTFIATARTARSLATAKKQEGGSSGGGRALGGGEQVSG